VPEVVVTVAGVDKTMSQRTREEVLSKLRRRYQSAGAEHKRQLLDQAQEVLGYHRKSAIRALRARPVERGPRIITGRPLTYEPGLLQRWLRPIWAATDYACGRRLVAMLPEWVPAYEQHERRLPEEVREKLLMASGRTLDRLLEPLRVQRGSRSLTRPGTLLRQQIPIRGSVWEEGKAGWLEVDTVALCGGSVAGEFVWMVDGVDYATTWVEVRAMWGRGQAGTLAALRDVEASLPFELLGLDSDNGGEFLNYHVLSWLQKRPRPVFMTRSRPYKKDDNAHVEQKNWTWARQLLGYGRLENPELVGPISALYREVWAPWQNFFLPCLKLESKWREGSHWRKRYERPRTAYDRLCAPGMLSLKQRRGLRERYESLDPFDLKDQLEKKLKEILQVPGQSKS